jgi:hypothetical protein
MSYIDEQKFRDLLSNVIKPNPFNATVNNQKITTITTNNSYIKTTSIFKVLAIDDTFHDLAQSRGTYNKITFTNNGPANYLLTGMWGKSDGELDYTDKLNKENYSLITPVNTPKTETNLGFKSKVARSIEVKNNLQRADISVTYDEILDGVSFTGNDFYINSEILSKIKQSNGSLIICKIKQPKQPKQQSSRQIKKSKKRGGPVKRERSVDVESGESVESGAFSSYIINILESKQKNITNMRNAITDAYKKICTFIRWYLYSDELNVFDTQLNATTPRSLPDKSMKILSDAGLSFLKHIFTFEGSKVTPFIAIPVFLDSANTSIVTLDNHEDIIFETVVPDAVVPIVSNYFSCEEFFMCYLLEGSTFDKDNLYKFSLAIFKIPEVDEMITFGANPVMNHYIKEAMVVHGKQK